MILKNSKIFVGDNTGIKKVKCINIVKKNVGFLGDIILFSIQKIKKKKKYIKKNIYFGLIINIKKKVKRLDGTYIKFKHNAVLTLSDRFNFLGTSVLFPICKEIKYNKEKKKEFKKIISYSKVSI